MSYPGQKAVLDHLILADAAEYSFAEAGLI
jgi:DNA repair protein RadC